MSIRDRLVALAVSFEGVSVSSDRERYLSLVAPRDVEPVAREAYFAHPKTSGCALVVRGLWRLAGLDHAFLAAPYRIGHAIVDVVGIAQEKKAWSTGTKRAPEPGDVVLVGRGGQEHVYTVVCARGDRAESIDGGQRDALGQQAILRRERVWMRGDDVVVGGLTRPVIGVVDVAKLFGD